MILVSKPVRIFDVDLIGAVMVAIVGIVAYVSVILPAVNGASAGEQLRQSVALADESIQRTAQRLDRYTQDIQALSRAVAERTAVSPGARDSAGLPSVVSAVAQTAGVHVLQMVPVAPRETEHGLISDLQVVARGSLLDLTRLLDRLRLECAHHQVLEYGVTESREHGDRRCLISFTLRLRLAAGATESKP
jgi:hypothetical protein